MRTLLLMIAALALSACATALPFAQVERTPMPSHDPAQVIALYKAAIPDQEKLLSSVTFGFGPQAITGIGVLELDQSAGTFAVACLNPMGMKLFELAGDRTATTTRFVLPMLERGPKGGFGTKIGEDIRRIYFDSVPSGAGWWSWWDDNELTVNERTDGGIMKYVFAGAEGSLVEKAYFVNDDLRWRVLYFGPERKNGKIINRGVLLQNYQYGYSLTVKVKEILD